MFMLRVWTINWYPYKNFEESSGKYWKLKQHLIISIHSLLNLLKSMNQDLYQNFKLKYAITFYLYKYS